MKKLTKLFAVHIFVLTTAFGLTGCNLLDMFGSSDYEYDAEKVQENINKMTVDGYKITIRYLEVGSETGSKPEIQSKGFTIAADGDLWYCEQDGETTIIDFSGDTEYNTYEKTADAEKWTKTAAAYSDIGSKDTVKSVYTNTYIATFTNYGVVAAGLKDKGEVTIAGRTCTKYVSSVSIAGFSYSNEYCIDNETELCLKNVMSAGSATDGSGTFSYECTVFETPYSVTVPAESDCVAPPSDENTETQGE